VALELEHKYKHFSMAFQETGSLLLKEVGFKRNISYMHRNLLLQAMT